MKWYNIDSGIEKGLNPYTTPHHAVKVARTWNEYAYICHNPMTDEWYAVNDSGLMLATNCRSEIQATREAELWMKLH